MIKLLQRFLFIFLCATGCTHALAGTDPECAKLKSDLPVLSPKDALVALDRFFAATENPEGCPTTEIQSWTGEAEQKLLRLVDEEGPLMPQMTLRCNQFNRKTTHCQGIEADDMLLINDQWFSRLRLPKGATVSIETQIADSKVVAVYKARISDLRRGKSAIVISPVAGAYHLGKIYKNSVVVAIFRTEGRWASWKYRKAVWFF